jgi:stage IV sporulation protein A
MLENIRIFSENVTRIGDIEREAAENEAVRMVSIDAGDGTAELEIPIGREVYYETVSEMCEIDIKDDAQLLRTVCELARTKRKYEKFERALEDVEANGYGIVMPTVKELKLDEPRVVKAANGYGVKVTAHADSIHMIKTDIKADLCPVVGSEEQSEKIIKSLAEEYEENPARVWEFNMFGKSLYELVSDGMAEKLGHMPDESRERLSHTLGKIIDEGANGLICILL